MNIKIRNLLRAGILLSIFLVLNTLYAQDKKKPTAEQFMKFVRTPPKQKTWAMLTGEATNMKKDKNGRRIITTSPIYLGVRFTSEMIFAQIIMGEDEIYLVGQPYSKSRGTASVSKEGDKKKNALKANFGIRPEDLTMSFIFWDLVKELSKESIRMISCRVFLLKSQDEKESVKVYISSDNYFPVKVEWSRPDKDKDFTKVVRSLEVDSFKEVNDLYLIDGLKFYGPGWRTNVIFPDCKAGYVKDGTPKDLFRSGSKK